MTCAVKFSASLAGSFLLSLATNPLFSSFTLTFFTLNPTLSPGLPWASCSWCISTDLTSVVRLLGAKLTIIPGLITPVSTLPTGTVPIPPILYTSCNGRRNGLSVGLVGGSIASMASSNVIPLTSFPLVSFFHPLYHVMLGLASNMLSPCHPLIGTMATVFGLYPTFLMNPETSVTISLYLVWLYWQLSILLMATINCLTPNVYANSACSRVCPSLEIPASNSPTPLAITRIAQSACDVPVIMFLMKSLCPGASITVT
eukprot:NODE_309_length_11266_cov_0.459479.p4 type:complete len:258 gc:universal NODE_309_length_11266_cov_0.459479:10165-10938(+)